MADFYEYSTPEIVRLIGERFKTYRMNAMLTQRDVAEHAGLAIKTVSSFENGTMKNLAFSTFVLLLRAIGMLNNLDDVLPEMPESLYLYNPTGTKKKQRIRHKKQ